MKTVKREVTREGYNIRDYLELEEKVEEEYTGIEMEKNNSWSEDVDDDDIPYNVNDIRVSQNMITVYQIEHWINQGNLNLSPEYQRNLVWDDRRKSALIESLMLKIPIPAFYLDENREGIKSVIDGMQRLSAIHDYLNDKFKLRKLQYLTGCERKVFSQLDLKFRSRIEDTILAVNILDERCPQIVKFDVFRRVNTGGLPLNPQEIRNIMAVPKVRLLLKQMAECPEFQLATKGKIRDIRMGAQELCLRFLTIKFHYDWEKKDFIRYYGLLKMMDSTVLNLNSMGDELFCKILCDFREVMRQCRMILGDMSFSKLDNNKINKSLFTGWAVVLDYRNESDLTIRKNAEIIKSRYLESLKNDTAFYNAITSSTGTRGHVLISLDTIQNIMEECL